MAESHTENTNSNLLAIAGGLLCLVAGIIAFIFASVCSTSVVIFISYGVSLALLTGGCFIIGRKLSQWRSK